jgi:hypothetical protein
MDNRHLILYKRIVSWAIVRSLEDTMFPLLLVAVSLSQPGPAIQLPAELKAAPGRIVQLRAETEQKSVRWLLLSEEADLVPFPDGKIALFSAPKAGRFTVLAWTARGDVPSEAAKCIVVVGEPTGPAPLEPLAREFRKLFDDDTDPNKVAHVAQMSALYREAIAFAEKAEVATAGDLAARIRAAATTLIPTESLVGIRKRIAEEIAKELPLDGDKPLDAATRTRAAKLFERIATRLEELK